MGANELLSKTASLQRFGNSLSFPTQATNCAGQRASCGVPGSANVEGRGFPSSLSKPGGNASTFTLDICTADTGGSLQKLNLGKHVLQGDALHFVKPHKQVGAGIGGSAAGTGTGMLDLSHRSLKAEIPRSKCTNGSPHYLFLFWFMALSCPLQQSLSPIGRDVRNKAWSAWWQ